MRMHLGREDHFCLVDIVGNGFVKGPSIRGQGVPVRIDAFLINYSFDGFGEVEEAGQPAFCDSATAPAR